MPHALRYREKALEFYEMAATARSRELRDQFVTLAKQYESLAASVDSMRDPSRRKTNNKPAGEVTGSWDLPLLDAVPPKRRSRRIK
jgi:hypothetical protein